MDFRFWGEHMCKNISKYNVFWAIPSKSGPECTFLEIVKDSGALEIIYNFSQ